jgi:hypothetical protein
MRRRVFADVAANGITIRLSALPPRLRFMKARYLGETTVLLNARLSTAALGRALEDAVDAALPRSQRMVAG